MWKLITSLSLVFLSLLATALPGDPNDDDFECLSSLQSYDAAESSYRTASSILSVVSTGTYPTTITNSNVPHTTLCDGRARALESYQYSTSTHVVTHATPWTVTKYPPYTGVSPTCEIAETACTPILSSYSSSWTEWLYNTGTATITSPASPHCTTTSTSSSETSTWRPSPTPTRDPACSRWPERCMIVAGYQKTLYYWPVTTVSGDFCQQNGSTLTPEPSITGVPNTAVLDGHTFTSPTNYLSVANAHAAIFSDYKHVDRCGAGGTLSSHTNILVPVTATLSTRTAAASDAAAAFAPVDFVHFNQPVPADSYDAFRCLLTGRVCAADVPIYDEGDYKPLLAVPDEILGLEDEWREVGCTYLNRNSWTSRRVTPVPLQTPPPRDS